MTLENSFTERELMMQEIHHRVKNNLQLVSSLLELQVEFAGSRTPAEVVRACQDRISSVSLLHEQLYSTENYQCTDIKDYLGQVVRKVHADSPASGPGKMLVCNLETFLFSMDKLITLGLIVHELLTNSLQHGFVEKGKFCIEISGFVNEEGYHLELRDNGRGFGYESALKKHSLGLKLVRGLARQAGAKLSYSNSDYCQFNLNIPIK